MATATAAALDAQQYAEALRRSLMEDLFEGDDAAGSASGSDAGGGAGGLDGLEDPDAAAAKQLRDLDKELEAYASHDVIRSVLDQGRVLQEYTADIDAKLRASELESIEDYIAESGSLVALHDQIQSCDGLLARMEALLSGFQGDLGAVSDEIRQLQVQSQGMATKLRNRRVAEGRLGAFIEGLAVPEELVAGIVESEVSEEYQEHLAALERRLRFAASDASAAGSAAARDVAPVLERLRIKAVTKVRDFLLAKLAGLRKPKTNAAIIQTSVLLRFKFAVRFLRAHAPDVLAELRGEYVGVMARLYSGHFRTYLGALERLSDRSASAGDVLGAPEASGAASAAVGAALGGAVASGVLSMFGARPTGGAAGGRGALNEHCFELSGRAAILGARDAPALVPSMAEAEGKRGVPYEAVFRHVHKLLLDTASAEFLFCVDFWGDEAAFRDAFSPVVALVEADLVAALPELWDPLALLLMIRLNTEQRGLMARRRVPCLDAYFDRLDLLLWPRFKVLFDAQHASVRPGAERALFGGGSVGDAPAVHYVTRRYAAFAASMLTLGAGLAADEAALEAAEAEAAAAAAAAASASATAAASGGASPRAPHTAPAPPQPSGAFRAASAFSEMLERLWGAMFDTLLRMSNLHRDRRAGIAFLVLNYSHIRAVLRAADGAGGGGAAGSGGGGGSGTAGGAAASSGGAAGAEAAGAALASPRATGGGGGALGAAGAAAIKECESQLATCTNLYVDDQLGAHFGKLVEYVRKAEQAAKRGNVPEGEPIPGYGAAEAAPVLRDFGARWNGAIGSMRDEAARAFGAADAGAAREALQAGMTALLLHYTRLLELLKRQGSAGQALAREAVNVPAIMYEIKRITKAGG